MISIIVPVHDMKNKDFFLKRCLDSIRAQSYQDYEIVISENGKGMASNTNAGIKTANGEIIKILFMDDYLAHANSLRDVVRHFKGGWLVTGCEHDNGARHNPHFPYYNPDIFLGRNTIGSPSVLAFENLKPLLFNEKLTWLLDCDLYTRLFEKYGEPVILNSINVVIGIGDHQTTHVLSEKVKDREYDYMRNKYKHV